MDNREYMLSVIVPVYNTEQYLVECVQSILNQTLKDIHIILVDDGSTDSSGQLCDQFAQQHESIQVIHKKNAGAGMARNTGLEAVRGKYVAFLDSDDYLENTYYASLVALAEALGADICYAIGTTQHSERSAYKERYNVVKPGTEFGGDAIKSLIPNAIFRKPGVDDSISMSANFCVYRSDVLERNHVRFVSERDFMSEDLWFKMDCLYFADRIAFSDEAGYIRRYNSESLSRCYNPARWEKLKRSMTMLEQKCRDMNLTDYEERLLMLFWFNFEKCINQVVRFEKNHCRSVRKLAEDPVSRHYLQCLSSNEQFRGLHGLLCRLLHKRMYFTTILCLKIYNKLVHG